MPRRHQARRPTTGRLVTGGVVVIGDEDPGDTVALEGLGVVGAEAGGAVGGGDVGEAEAIEAERVEERLAQDHLVTGEPLFVPHPTVGTGEVEVGRGARAQAPADLAPVELGDGACWGDHRHDERAAEVLVAAGAQHAELHQAAAQRVAVLGRLVRQPIAEGPVGIAQPEAFDHRRVVDLATGQVGQGLGGIGQGGVVVVHDPGRAGLGPRPRRRGHRAACGPSSAWEPARSGRA